ncbi:uncharacterized protein LOC125045801 [Penaeus chinensis]|uniref:uncharacterized protein LOC125045801 n=1 Tax=Penaeus chinensis TaxID=139456 RepID=UPI001FB6779D|nr:uncharacterized protein LOC125045801 [Penaeus chinensis]
MTLHRFVLASTGCCSPGRQPSTRITNIIREIPIFSQRFEPPQGGMACTHAIHADRVKIHCNSGYPAMVIPEYSSNVSDSHQRADGSRPTQARKVALLPGRYCCGWAPRRLDYVLPLDQARKGQESEADDLRNSPSLKSKSSASHDFIHSAKPKSPVAMGERRSSSKPRLAGIPHSGRTRKKKQVKVLNLGTRNVRTLLDNTKADRPERRTALVAKTKANSQSMVAGIPSFGADIAPLNGHQIPPRPETNEVPEGINDRLMSLQFPLENKKSVMLISAYAPTMTNPKDIKDNFYEELDALIAAVPQSEKLFILGDFRARLFTTHDLTLTNTLIRLLTCNKTTWIDPSSRYWHLIDYVIPRKRDVQDVRVTRVMCGADCWTDHRLIVSKCKLCILPKRRPQSQKSAKRLNVSKLKNSNIAQEFARDLDDRLPYTPQDEQDSSEEQWTAFREVVYSTALEHLGPATRKHQDWFNENDGEIQALLLKKYRAMRTVNTKRFYDALKTVYGPQSAESSPLLTADGTQQLTEKKQILDRDLDNPPTEEVRKAVNQLSCGKAPGSDAIPVEVYKAGGPALMQKLTELFQSMWSEGKVSQQLKDATMVHIYKRKGNRQSLLSITGKILACVLLNRLLQHLEQGHLPESQCSFQAERGTVDLTKAFDTVSRDGL